MDPIGRPVSFCLLEIEDREKELALFQDINNNQMGMNTSHLQNITARLTPEQLLKVKNPALYIVKKLATDKNSPFCNRVHEGGKVEKGATLSGLTIANLTNAVRDMLSRSTKLAQFQNADTQYRLIRNFWAAVKAWLPDAWNSPRNYSIFKGVGLNAVSYVGVEVIDRALLKGRFSRNDILGYLKQISSEALASGGTAAYSGRGGGQKLANELIANLEEEGEISLERLDKLILSEG
jgi:hypothetical protein